MARAKRHKYFYRIYVLMPSGNWTEFCMCKTALDAGIKKQEYEAKGKTVRVVEFKI